MTNPKNVIKSAELAGSPGRTNLRSVSGGVTYEDKALNYVPFGTDNMWPQAVAYINRRAPIHRGILNNKTTYITGKGFVCDENQKELAKFLLNSNAAGWSLRKSYKRKVYDKQSYGNGYFEIVTDKDRTFINFEHKDSVLCRVGKNEDEGFILLHPNWRNWQNEKALTKKIPLYPNFEKNDSGFLHCIVHIKDYESEFETYGVSNWIAGLKSSAIGYKTDSWNESRLDKGFKYSGVLIVDGEFKDTIAEEKFDKDLKAVASGEGNQGDILTIKKPLDGSEGSKFVPLQGRDDADWVKLHEMSESNLVIAHSWFRTLTGLNTSTGFDTSRILNEYQVALSTVIEDEQQEFLEIYKSILQDQMDWDCSSLAIVNRPPILEKPAYMKVWEARKLDGMDFDDKDPSQMVYLAELGRAKTITLQ